MATATVLETLDLRLDSLLATPEGRPLLSCIQCGTCAGTCPYGDVMSYTPRRLIGMLREGFIEEAIVSDSAWTCPLTWSSSPSRPGTSRPWAGR